MKLKQPTQSLLMGALALLGPFVITPCLSRADVSQGQALTVAQRVLRVSGITNSVKLNSASIVDSGRVLRLRGPDTDPRQEVDRDPKGRCYSFQFEEGITQKEHVTVDISVKTGRLLNFNWTRHSFNVHTASPDSLSSRFGEPACQQSALQWMRAVGQPLAGDSCLYQSSLPGNGLCFLNWRRCDKRNGTSLLLPPYISVGVDTQTGDVGSYNIMDFDVLLQSFATGVAPENAVALARKAISEGSSKSQFGLTEVEVGKLQRAWLVLLDYPAYKNYPATQHLVWDIHFVDGNGRSDSQAGQPGAAVAIDWEIRVDAETGQILRGATPHFRRAGRGRQTLEVVNTSPVWTGRESASLTFATSQAILGDTAAGDPLDPVPNTIASVDSHNMMLALIKTPSGINRGLDSTSDGNRIAWVDHGTVSVLDLKTGAIGKCNDGLRVTRLMPAWDPTGGLMAMSGSHPAPGLVSFDDDDIFVAKLTTSLSSVSVDRNWCVAHLSGRDILPVFSPDGQWIIFAHEELPSQERNRLSDAGNGETTATWAIYRVKAAMAYTDKSYESPQRIVSNLPMPERLSVLPDGEKVLVSYEGNGATMTNQPDIVDLVAKARRPLPLSPLHDPGQPNLQPLIMHELTVNRAGTQIAFRAFRPSSDPRFSGAVCLYKCNFDGSALQCVTPPSVRTLQPFKYPQPGITALNAWEKLEPKPNLGRAWSPAIQEAERRHQIEERETSKGKPINAGATGAGDAKAANP